MRRLAVAPVSGILLGAVVPGAGVAAQEPQGLYGPHWPAASKPHVRVPILSKMYESIKEVKVREGDLVKKDQELIVYEDRVIRARVAIAKEEANLDPQVRRLDAKKDYAARNYSRLLAVLGSALLEEGDVLDWQAFCEKLDGGAAPQAPGPVRRLWSMLPAGAQKAVRAGATNADVPPGDRRTIISALNEVLAMQEFYRAEDFAGVVLGDEVRRLLVGGDELRRFPWKVQRLNRLLFETAFADETVRCHAPYVSDAEIDKADFECTDADLEADQLEQEQRVRKAYLDYYKQQEKEYHILSPLDGVVAAVSVEAGQTVKEGEPLIEVIDPGTIEVQVRLPEQYVRQVRKGQPVKVRFTAYSRDEELDGSILHVSPEVVPTDAKFKVTIVVRPGDVPIRPGESCDVRFVRTGQP